MKVAIYGGTFNPPHLGHTRVIYALKETIDPDRILLIPNYLPPHKEMEENAPDADQRLEMASLAFSEIEKCEISDMEIRRGGKSYTYETIDELKSLNGDDELYLVVGSDMLLSFTEWKRYQYILENSTLVCASRTGEDREELLAALPPDGILLENEPVVISSSEIRADVDRYKELLDPRVYEYITKNRLYSKGNL